MELTHQFIHHCENPLDLFESNLSKMTISKFSKRLVKQSETKEVTDRFKSNDYKGDGFELFVEAFVKAFGYHPDVGIYKYQPNPHKDMGIDGIGYGIIDGGPASVQAKFKSNVTSYLTSDDRISNFVASSLLNEDHKVLSPRESGHRNMLVVTTCKGLHHVLKEDMYCSQVRVIGREQLSLLVDYNQGFWGTFKEDFVKAWKKVRGKS